MMHFTVADMQPQASNCVVCCCEKVSLKPGTTTRLSVGYAPWVVPIGWLHCTPQFALEQMETCPPAGGTNMPPQPNDDMALFNTGVGVQLVDDLASKVTDPEDDPLTFKVLGLYAPKHGKFVLAPVGTFTYDPNPGYMGEERFFCSVSDGFNPPRTFEIMIAVGIDSGTMKSTPHVSVGKATVDQRYHSVSFPVTVSPAAEQCEVWRLTVLQGALDCDCTCYTRTDCFDIGIAKC